MLNCQKQLSITAQILLPLYLFNLVFTCVFRTVLVESTTCASPLWKVQCKGTIFPSNCCSQPSPICNLPQCFSRMCHRLQGIRLAHNQSPIDGRVQQCLYKLRSSISHASVLTRPPQHKHVCNISYVLILSDCKLMNTITIIIIFPD